MINKLDALRERGVVRDEVHVLSDLIYAEGMRQIHPGRMFVDVGASGQAGPFLHVSVEDAERLEADGFRRVNVHPNLLLEVRSLCKGDARQQLMIDTAASVLRRFEGDRIFEIALFAIDSAEKAALRGARAIDKADQGWRVFNLPDYEETVLRGHRMGISLSIALEENDFDPPYRASRHQVFAALGLLVLKAAVLDSIVSRRAMLLLDAAECIYAWEHLKPPTKPTAPWKEALHAMLPRLVLSNGKKMSAKDAYKLFHEEHPSFKDEAEHLPTFGKTLSQLRNLR